MQMVPARARVHAQLISSAELRGETRLDTADGHSVTCGLDVSAINRYCIESYMDLDLATASHKALSEPFEALVIDLQGAADRFCEADSTEAGEPDAYDGLGWQRLLFPQNVGEVFATAAGQVDAIAFWFDLDLPGGGTLCTGPGGSGSGGSHWKQAATVVALGDGRAGRTVAVGEKVAVRGAVVDSCVRFSVGE